MEQTLLGQRLHLFPDRLVARCDGGVEPVAVGVRPEAVDLRSMRLEKVTGHIRKLRSTVRRPAVSRHTQFLLRTPHRVHQLVIGLRNVQPELVEQIPVEGDRPPRPPGRPARMDQVVGVKVAVLLEVVESVHRIGKQDLQHRVAPRVRVHDLLQIDDQPVLDPIAPLRDRSRRMADPGIDDVTDVAGRHPRDDHLVVPRRERHLDLDVERLLDVPEYDIVLRDIVPVDPRCIPTAVVARDGDKRLLVGTRRALFRRAGRERRCRAQHQEHDSGRDNHDIPRHLVLL